MVVKIHLMHIANAADQKRYYVASILVCQAESAMDLMKYFCASAFTLDSFNWLLCFQKKTFVNNNCKSPLELFSLNPDRRLKEIFDHQNYYLFFHGF